MKTFLKILKAFFIFIGVIATLVILTAAYFLFKGYKTGNLEDYLKKSAVENVIDAEKLSPRQKELLEEGNVEELAKDLEENVTQEQINCAAQAVGEKRAQELREGQKPTSGELFKLSKCL